MGKKEVCVEFYDLKQIVTLTFLKAQVLIWFLPSVPWGWKSGVTVMDSCKLGTNKCLQVVDLGPRAPVDGPSRRSTLN